MSEMIFDNVTRMQIGRVIEFARDNVYKVDDILDMMNGDLINPESLPEHLVLVPIGQWICYYLLEHPTKGHCHYFKIKSDATGKLPDMDRINYILNVFGIEHKLQNQDISMDSNNDELKIIIKA